MTLASSLGNRETKESGARYRMLSKVGNILAPFLFCFVLRQDLLMKTRLASDRR